jgi:hypothetical protein
MLITLTPETINLASNYRDKCNDPVLAEDVYANVLVAETLRNYINANAGSTVQGLTAEDLDCKLEFRFTDVCVDLPKLGTIKLTSPSSIPNCFDATATFVSTVTEWDEGHDTPMLLVVAIPRLDDSTFEEKAVDFIGFYAYPSPAALSKGAVIPQTIQISDLAPFEGLVAEIEDSEYWRQVYELEDNWYAGDKSTN